MFFNKFHKTVNQNKRAKIMPNTMQSYVELHILFEDTFSGGKVRLQVFLQSWYSGQLSATHVTAQR